MKKDILEILTRNCEIKENCERCNDTANSILELFKEEIYQLFSDIKALGSFDLEDSDGGEMIKRKTWLDKDRHVMFGGEWLNTYELEDFLKEYKIYN